MIFLKKLWRTLRFGLVFNELRYLFVKMGIEISPFYWTQENPGLPDSLRLKNGEAGYSFDFFGPEEMKQIAKLTKYHPENMLLSRLDEGKLCYGLLYNGRIAAFTWFDMDECNYKGNRHKLKKDEVYLFDLYTMDNFRGQNLGPYLRYNSYKVLADMGKKNIFSVTQITNSSAIKFKNKVNAKFLWLGVYINFFNKINRTYIIKKFSS